jgi:membrane-associated phospholipid phosphatase
MNPNVDRWRRTLAQVLTQALNTPVVAGAMVTWLMFKLPGDVPGRLTGWGYSLLFLTVIPLLSVLFYIPFAGEDWKHVLRRQRIASFVFMAVSYPVGLVVVHFIGAPKIYEALLTSYVGVVLGLIVINLFYKASGHAAGVAGPVSAVLYLRGWMALPVLALIPLVGWARVQVKGHTAMQIVAGTILSALTTLIVLGVYGMQPGMLAH